MPSLEFLQESFTQSAFGEPDAAFVSVIQGGGKLTPAEAVGVYREGYSARLSEALGETFEACWRMLGDEAFLGACRDYSRSVRSVSHNLSDYGKSFPDFLLERFRDEAPFIGELGKLEWSFKELFHAAPHAGLSPLALSKAVKENSVLIFGPAVLLMHLDHSVHALWRRDRSDASPLSRADWEGPQDILMYKRGGTQVFSSVIAAPGASALRSLIKGTPLGEALAAAAGLDEAAARDLFSFISEAGLVTEVR